MISGDELRARRLALGLSQHALADALSVRQATVARWEAGDRHAPASIDDDLAALEDQLETWSNEQVRDGVTIPPFGKDARTLIRTVAAARALVKNRRHFDAWLQQVDNHLTAHHITRHDLPDYTWRDAYEAETPAGIAAQTALEHGPAGESDPQGED